MAVIPVPPYPSLQTVMNLVRSLINDTMAGATGTPGEGQIVTDNPTISPMTPALLNSAIRTLYRKVRNIGTPTLIRDNYILENLPVVNGPQGSGVPDPTIQQQLTFEGFFDGTSYNPDYLLPSDCMAPLEMWERATSSGNPFCLMTQSQFGLSPRFQTQFLGDWEWRGDAIWLNGAIGARDIRIRYQAIFPQFFGPNIDYTSTLIPVMDCEEVVAYRVAADLAPSFGTAPPLIMGLEQKFLDAVADLRGEITRRAQSVNYRRMTFQGNQGGGGVVM